MPWWLLRIILKFKKGRTEEDDLTHEILEWKQWGGKNMVNQTGKFCNCEHKEDSRKWIAAFMEGKEY